VERPPTTPKRPVAAGLSYCARTWSVVRSQVVRSPSSLPPKRSSGFLRPEPSRFVGRGEDLDRLDAPLASSRLVTLVGPGGIGKTRLALRYATTHKGHFGSVWFCDMRDARTHAEMAQVLLRAFGGSRSVLGSADATLLHTLAARPLALVVLDNLEHLLPNAAAVVRRWIAAAPGVRFLATSREPLGLSQEHVVAIGGVAAPDAVELFVDRVRERMTGWAPRDDERSRIAEVARRLAGVPLALELAAARVGAEDTGALLARLSSRPAPAEVALRRAFALLSADERALLRRCSIFRGSFSLAAAAAVTADLAEVSGDVVVRLAERNLLRVERHRPMRFSMCEGIRALAESTLGDAEARDLARAHARFMLERARAVAGDEPAPADAADDWDDLHAALSWAAESERPDVVLHAALALERLALGGGLGEVALAQLDEALRRGAASDLDLLARALLARSSTLYALGRLLEARRDAETALALAEDLSATKRIGEARRASAQAAFQLGELDAVREHLQRALEIERDRGDHLASASVHRHLGSLYNSLGELDQARDAFERSLKLAAASGDGSAEAYALLGLGWNDFERGERDRARAHYERAIVLLRRLKMARSERIAVGYLGLVDFYEGDLARAEERLRQAALASRRAGDLRVEGIFEGVLGGVLAAADRIDESRAALGLADELLAGNAFYRGAVAVYRGLLDLAEARAAAADGAARTALAHVARARWRIEEAHALARRSDDARIAVRILERALARA
jgi:predicted ATPase